MSKLFSNQRGFGHTGIIAIILVILVVGGVGWWVWKNNKDDSPQQQAIQNAQCDFEDKDICKFFASWKATDSYTVESTAVNEGQTVKTTIKSEGADKTYVKFTGENVNYETITIGNTLYTKAGDTWYKQTLNTEEVAAYQGDVDTDFTEPTDGGTISYTKVGTEDCGDHKCFKYQVIDTETPDVTQYLWFDTKDYQLRRMQITNTDGSSYDSTFSYGKVTVSEPSPVQELGENQYIVPGQTEPVTMPSTGDDLNEQQLQDLLNQYQ